VDDSSTEEGPEAATGTDPAAAPPTAPSRGRPWLAVGLSAIGVLIVVVVVLGFVIHLPYVIISPGEATPLDEEVVTVDGAPTYGSAGNILFLTVRVSNHDPTVWRVLTSVLDSDREVEKRSNVVGCLSDTENSTINARLMQQSQDSAQDVALTRLGYTVEADPPEITVVEVCQGAPAYHHLQAGDQVLAIDDQPIAALEDVVPLVQQRKPGEPVDVTYLRDGGKLTTTVPTGRWTADKTVPGGRRCAPVDTIQAEGEACMGAAMQPFVTYAFPVDVKIDTQTVGGPSAGLAFTLAIIDDLTEGDLTGGRRVAVTGTIAPDGSVGPVGGVEQKAITARHNDVGLMIVPKSEIADAKRGAGNVRVVGVDNVDEALAALQRNGGAPVPPPSSFAARS
jgi:PDZ domain-containing protein